MSKVVKGWTSFSFTTLVVVGDGEGTVGVGYGRPKEVPQAISDFFRFPDDPPHGTRGAGSRYRQYRPAPTGCPSTGDRRRPGARRRRPTCSPSRKAHPNTISIVHATVDALKQLEQPGLSPLDAACPSKRVIRVHALARSAAAEERRRPTRPLQGELSDESEEHKDPRVSLCSHPKQRHEKGRAPSGCARSARVSCVSRRKPFWAPFAVRH